MAWQVRVVVLITALLVVPGMAWVSVKTLRHRPRSREEARRRWAELKTRRHVSRSDLIEASRVGSWGIGLLGLAMSAVAAVFFALVALGRVA